MTWIANAPELAELDDQSRKSLGALVPMTLPKGAVIFRPGDSVQGYAIVLSGKIDVFLTGLSGRELLLYTVEPGQSCIQTTMGLLGGEDYTAQAEAVEETRFVLLPQPLFLSLIDRSASFRHVVFHAFAQRMQTMMQLLEKVAFQRVECRLAARLLDLSQTTNPVKITQADLATQVGSAREVISRRLDGWSRKGWVRTGRGTVEVLNAAALSAIAQADF